MQQTEVSNLPDIAKLSDEMSTQEFRTQFPELYLHWEQILTRALLYSSSDSYPSSNKSFFYNKNTKWRFNEIQLGIDAWKQLQHNQTLSANKKKEIEWELSCALDIELSYLALRQYLKLSKDQDVYRPEIVSMQNSLKLKIELLNTTLRKNRLSQQIPADALQLRTFFKKYERFYVDFDKTIFRSQEVGDGVGAVSTTIMIMRFSPSSILKAVDPRILFAIPSTSAIVASIPLLLGALRTYIDNRNTKKKIIDTAMAAFVVAGIAVAISMPITVIVISSTFISLGVLKDYMLPLYQLWAVTRRKKKELGTMDSKLAKIQAQTPEKIILDARDKAALMRKLESYCLQNNLFNAATILAARSLIENEPVTIQQLAQNDLIKSATGAHSTENLKQFFYHSTLEQKDRLTREIKTLKAGRGKSIALAVNGLLTLTGAAFFCIPTPMTMMIGAFIMGGAAFMNIAIKYDYFPKAWRFVSGLFKRSPVNEPAKASGYQKNSAMRNLHKQVLSADERNENEKEHNLPVEPIQSQSSTGMVSVADTVIAATPGLAFR